jgi:hypothetical protein
LPAARSGAPSAFLSSQTDVAPACALQTCLNKNTYTPEKCDAPVRALYLCCARMYAAQGDGAESTACPMASVTRRWLKDHREKDA